jgi:hypothetical protein
MANSQINEKWKKIFDDLPILQEVKTKGFFDISALTIRKYHEPRLMCKMDFLETVPDVFVDNGLSILAISNGKYKIAKTTPFVRIDFDQMPQVDAKTFHLPKEITTLDADRITSESKALDAALASGMLKDLMGDDAYLTVRGREYCKPFSFELKNSNETSTSYNVESVQVEIDGGYETKKSIYLIEAKMDFKSNMNLRQLLYPELNFKQIYKKEVRSYVFFYGIGGLFHFIPFIYEKGEARFVYEDYKVYKLEKKATLPVIPESISINYEDTDPDIPFPQADKFDKVYSLFLEFVNQFNQDLTKEQLFENYDFVPRQHDYYLNTLKWMKLIEESSKNSGCYSLTKKGARIANLSESHIIQEMFKSIYSNDIFNGYTRNQYQNYKEIPQDILKRNGLNAESTVKRRFQTVKMWHNFYQAYLEIQSKTKD